MLEITITINNYVYYNESFGFNSCNIIIYNDLKERIYCERYYILPVFLFYKYGTWCYAIHLDILQQNELEYYSKFNYYLV